MSAGGVSRSAEKFRVGLVQMSCTADPRDNLRKATQRIRDAAEQGAQVVCLQELFANRYFCQREEPAVFGLAEPVPGPTTAALEPLARQLKVVLIVSVFERRIPGVYHNTAAVIDADGQLLGIYRKMHIPDDPRYHEKYYFTPGDLGFKVFQTRYARVGVLVCWDQWFPEAARLTTMQGASILFCPTAIGHLPEEKAEFGPAQRDAWELIQRSHALANGIYVAAVNRVGREPGVGEGLDFWGGSFLSDPFGIVVTKAAYEQEQILLAECDLKHMETVRCHWPFLRDRRIDAYGPLTQRVSDGAD